MADTVAIAIKEAREKKQISRPELAALVGRTRGAIHQWETGDTKPSRETIPRLAEVLDLPIAILMNGHATGVPQDPPREHGAPFEVPWPSVRTMPADVPLVYTAHAITGRRDQSLAGADFLIRGDAMKNVRRTPRLAGRGDVRAMYAHGDKMAPRFREGELVYFETARPPKAGDYVVVILKDNGPARPCMIRKLVKMTGAGLVTEQHNPRRIVTIPRLRLHEVARVMDLADIMDT